VSFYQQKLKALIDCDLRSFMNQSASQSTFLIVLSNKEALNLKAPMIIRSIRAILINNQDCNQSVVLVAKPVELVINPVRMTIAVGINAEPVESVR
jgi:hypothetical protein